MSLHADVRRSYVHEGVGSETKCDLSECVSHLQDVNVLERLVVGGDNRRVNVLNRPLVRTLI
jgi:hypothetical protein